MAIGAKKSNGTAISPMPDGVNQAVITGVKELGNFTGQNGKVRFVVVAEFTDAEGNVASRAYTGDPKTKSLSLHEKSNLAVDLTALFGRAPEELDDVEKLLVGRQAQVITEAKVNAKGYKNAKVTKVIKPAKGQNIVPAAAPAAPAAPAPQISDEDIPF